MEQATSPAGSTAGLAAGTDAGTGGEQGETDATDATQGAGGSAAPVERCLDLLEESWEPTPPPISLSPDEREELAAITAARHDWIAAAGRQQREVAHGAYARVANFLVSPACPGGRGTSAG
jgi:hypothetical protein